MREESVKWDRERERGEGGKCKVGQTEGEG